MLTMHVDACLQIVRFFPWPKGIERPRMVCIRSLANKRGTTIFHMHLHGRTMKVGARAMTVESGLCQLIGLWIKECGHAAEVGRADVLRRTLAN